MQSLISRYSQQVEQLSMDQLKLATNGVVFNNVYDNGYSNNQVIFSFRDNLKNGRLFKKGSNTLASNKYPPYDMAVNYNPDRSLNVDKVHRDVARGTKEAIDFLESDIKKEKQQLIQWNQVRDWD